MDNRGHHLIAVDDSAINTPAIAAGHVIKRYTGQARDELSFEVSVSQCFSRKWTGFSFACHEDLERPFRSSVDASGLFVMSQK